MNQAELDRARADVCADWLSHLGEAYYWGRMDCSHLVIEGHQKAGTWPLGPTKNGYRTAGQIFLLPSLLVVDFDARQPGDIVGYGDPGSEIVHHVVGVLPDGLIGANSGGKPLPGETPEDYVARESLADARVKRVGPGYWASHRVGVRRVPRLDPSLVTGGL